MNEEYDDWYYTEGEKFYYKDESDVSKMLEQACVFIHTCMDTEQYKEGSEIGRMLFSIKIICESEYGDENLTIWDMVYHGLFKHDPFHICSSGQSGTGIFLLRNSSPISFNPAQVNITSFLILISDILNHDRNGVLFLFPEDRTDVIEREKTWSGYFCLVTSEKRRRRKPSAFITAGTWN